MDLQSLVLLSLLLWSRSQAEVVNSVSECSQFFLRETPPQIPEVLQNREIINQNRYKPICQTYGDRPRFFTLYDTKNKIPVFSAYIFKGNEPRDPNTEDNKRTKNWRIEPQLQSNMVVKCGSEEVSQSQQASDKDYTGSGYTRGHICPNMYGYTREDRKSTFTLTNAVPQVGSFNGGSWNHMEECVKCVMEKYCKNQNEAIEGHLVTGAVPGNRRVKDKINIPSVMWSAFCCYSNREQRWLASGYWGNNEEEAKGQYLETRTLNELYRRFSTESSEFNLFPHPEDQCPLDETVAQFYPDINAENKMCQCPPINLPDNNSPDNNSPDNNSPDNNSPDNNSPDDNSPDDNSPDDNSPDNNSPNNNSPDDNLPDASDNMVTRAANTIMSYVYAALDRMYALYQEIKGLVS